MPNSYHLYYCSDCGNILEYDKVCGCLDADLSQRLDTQVVNACDNCGADIEPGYSICDDCSEKQEIALHSDWLSERKAIAEARIIAEFNKIASW